jgi:transposase
MVDIIDCLDPVAYATELTMDPDSIVETVLTDGRTRSGGGRRLDRASLAILRAAALAHMGAGAEVREVAHTLGMSRSTLYRWRALASGAPRRAAGRPAPADPADAPATPATPATPGASGAAATPGASATQATCGSAGSRGASGTTSAPSTRGAVGARPRGPWRPPGRFRGLPAAVADALRDVVTGEPRAAGLTAGLWTMELVRTVLARDFGMRVTAAQSRRVLRDLGLWPRRPLPSLIDIGGDDWVATELPRIEAKAATEDATPHFVFDTLVAGGAAWLLTAAAPGGARRFALYDVAAMAPAPSGPKTRAPSAQEPTAHGRAMCDFLERLTRAGAAPVYAILEPLPGPDARAVDRLARASNGLLRVFYLPDVLSRLDRCAGRWRLAHADTREHAAVRDQAIREFQDAKAAEERARAQRDEAIAACRAADVPIAVVVRHTGLAPKTVYDALARPPARPPARDDEPLTRLDEATERWRAAVTAAKEHSAARERATRAYREVKAVEERLRGVRDDAITAWRASGVQAGVLATRTGLSGGLISQIIGRSRPGIGSRGDNDDEGGRGMAAHLLAELEQVSEQWREALATARDQARARDEAARAYREGKALEEQLRALRDRAIAECRAAGVPVTELASSTGLDISTIYGVCHSLEP